MLNQQKQSFGIAGGLNPVQIEIEDNRVLNIFKKYKQISTARAFISNIPKKRH